METPNTNYLSIVFSFFNFFILHSMIKRMIKFPRIIILFDIVVVLLTGSWGTFSLILNWLFNILHISSLCYPQQNPC